MAFVTRGVETTWGDLREGERIVDKEGGTWKLGKPEPVGTEVRVTIYADPYDDRTVVGSVVVVKPATDTVTVIREAVEPVWKRAGFASQEAMDTAAVTAAENVFGPDPELEQAKATVEDAMGSTVEVLPVIDTALELRSHLYLLHGVMIHEATTRAALLEHHRQSEKLEAAGRGNEGYVPHVHEEDK